MLTVAFLSNEFPSPIETYVIDQLEELRKRGVRVIAGGAWRARSRTAVIPPDGSPDVVPSLLQLHVVARAAWLCAAQWRQIIPLVARVVAHGKESAGQRFKALAHTFLGACYAAALEGRGVEHIHAHHGYFSSWIAMSAARLLGVPFSMTLYGSDLLLHAVYLDAKLANCAFCITISEFNRQYILKHYPDIDPGKLEVVRLGVDVIQHEQRGGEPEGKKDSVTLLAVGRLHPVKDHAFLVRACAELLARKMKFECFIVGGGPEYNNLELLIRRSGLKRYVHLLGFVSQEKRDALYEEADIVVLTSRSEGIPVVLMEAMGRGKIVLAPAITGIPELVIEGKSGFLYQPGMIDDFVAHVQLVASLMQSDSAEEHDARLDRIRRAASQHIAQEFSRRKNLKRFGDVFLQRLGKCEAIPDENLVLQ